MQYDISGVNTVIDSPAVLTGTHRPDLDFSVNNFAASVEVDGGGAVAVLLDSAFANLDDLAAELMNQVSGIVVTSESHLIVTSVSEGDDAEISWTNDEDNVSSLYIADADVFGSSETVTGNTLIAFSPHGSASNPTQVLIQNVGPDPDNPFDGPVLEVSFDSDLTFGQGIQVYAGQTYAAALITSDKIYATAADGETVDARSDRS